MHIHHRQSRVVAIAAIVSLISPPFLEVLGAQTTTTKPAGTTAPAAPAKPAAPQTPPKPGTTTTPTTTATPTTTTPAKPATTTTTAPTTTAAKPAATTTAAKPASPPIVDGGWPRGRTMSNGSDVTVYQPQVASWPDQKKMTILAAVSYLQKAGSKPSMGTIKAEADTRVSVSERLVSFGPLRISESNFPDMSRDQVRDIVAAIDEAIPETERVIGLDRVLEAVDKSQILPKNIEGVKADPPTIYFSKTPAVLVITDGEPIWSPIQNNDLKYAVNTNWDLFLHDPSKTYYLRNEESWLKAMDLAGPWTPAGKLPESFSKLPKDDPNWTDVKKNLPGKKIDEKKVPTVFYDKMPAEMILLTGEPSYVSVQGAGDLLWVNNTESDVFRMGKAGPVYYLVSGRWFKAADFKGPWTFTSTDMPQEFLKIPLEHPRSRVLAAVPGSQQAAEAVLLAQVPQTARVNKKTIQAPDVVYQGGEPKFEPIATTSVSRAVNTDKDIIKVGDLYYMCFQGVWFMSKGATGPWEVATTVPKEIYQIPASSQAHNVTYVVVEDDDDDNDEWVTFAAVAGYTGVMIAWGCAVWGSGWYYPPYYGYGGMYPFYYPAFHSYGYSAWYNPWTGGYGRRAVAYGPYGGAGVGARYNPRTGTYSRGAAAWGPYGARGAGQAFNPRTGTYAQTRQGSNVYGSWGSTQVQRGDNWASTNRVTNNRTGNTTRVTTGSGGGTAVSRNPAGPGGGTVARTGGGDVYAGQDGNVYRRNEGGGWSQYDNGNWNNVDTSGAQQRADQARANGAGSGARAGTQSVDSATAGQLNKDGAARSTGTQRTGDLGTYRGSGSGSGSYRPSGGSTSRPSGGGGGMRAGGGGGRRR